MRHLVVHPSREGDPKVPRDAGLWSPPLAVGSTQVDADAVIADLLAQPLDQFTLRRNARAKELKAAGQADLANEISVLKKPSISLWAANQVRDRGLLGGVRGAAQRVVTAQAAAAAGRSGAPRDLRAASEEFQRTIEAAGDAAANRLREGHHASAEDTVRRIREIFRLAALEGGGTWDRLQKGALIAEPRAGDDLLEMFGAGAAPATGKRAEQQEARRAAEQADRAARADEELAQRATETARRLRVEATEAEAAAKRAAQRAAAAEEEAERARAQAKKSNRQLKARGSRAER
jgi:hypothetical protein